MPSRTRSPRAVTAAAAMVCAAVALAAPSSALAVSGGPANQTVAGTAVDLLGLAVITPASALAPIQPGATATSSGVLTVTSTSTGNWTLYANDANTATGTAGHPLAAASGCTGSAAALPAIGVTATGTNVTSSGQVTLSGTAQQVAVGPSTGLAIPVTTAFSDAIPTSTALVSGCGYSLTTVFTASAN